MCPPADQVPPVLDQADAATMPLPDSSPDSPDVIAKNNNDSESDSIKSDETHDVLAPLPSETEAAVTTSGTGGLATIKEQTDSTSPNDELSTVKNTISESTATDSIDCETSDHHALTGAAKPTVALPPPKSEPVADNVCENDSAGLTLQQKDRAANAVRSTAPETAVTTNPTIIVSGEGSDELNNGSSKRLDSASTDNAVVDPAKSEDHKFVDPNDKDNIGSDVIKFFYTSSTRKRPSSPVAAAPDCCNPRLHRDSDLYIKAKGKDGKAYVFEVVSATLEKASPKFEAMIYGSHTRGNKEEWVWELDDNP